MIRPILNQMPDHGEIVNSAQFMAANEAISREFYSALEFYLPSILYEAHPHWERSESFDGVGSIVTRALGANEVEIFAECILISDQTTVPMHFRFQISPIEDEMTWLELRVGEMVNQRMKRLPYASSKSNVQKLFQLAESEESMKNFNWAYHVGFGERKE